jgi:hypothetical protein
MRKLILILIFVLPFTAQADSSLPFMKDLAGDRELPRPWGISLDYYTMKQDYKIKDLQFSLPGAIIDDPSKLGVKNNLDYYDFKADVWLFPFLNIFGTVGKVDATTTVDFSSVVITGLPVPIQLGEMDVDYDGTVWGAGFTLAYGGDAWFTSLTTTFTHSKISGDFDSTVDSTSIQPRVGFVKEGWLGWVGGMWLDVDEKHEGIFELPFIGAVPFAVELETSNKWGWAVGTAYYFSDKANMTIEYGFGDRNYTLVNVNYRF